MQNLTPYLKSLKAFEAAARHQSFSAAAKELFVTPAAVGQLVKQLEDQLGVELFVRNAAGQQRLTLTEKAKLALPDIQTGFGYLNKGLDCLKNCVDNDLLTITLSPSLAAKWLLPRLDSFQEQHPELSVRLHTDIKTLDFMAHSIDVGIRYGLGEWHGLQAETLFDEDIFPVCSPVFLQKNAINEPLALLHLPLIHDVSMDENTGFHSWQFWLKQANLPHTMPKAGLRINSSAAVLQAAMDGQGIALARSVMVQEDLKAGRLVQLFPEITLHSKLAYYLVYRPESETLSKVQKFREWLLMNK